MVYGHDPVNSAARKHVAALLSNPDAALQRNGRAICISIYNTTKYNKLPAISAGPDLYRTCANLIVSIQSRNREYANMVDQFYTILTINYPDYAHAHNVDTLLLNATTCRYTADVREGAHHASDDDGMPEDDPTCFGLIK